MPKKDNKKKRGDDEEFIQSLQQQEMEGSEGDDEHVGYDFQDGFDINFPKNLLEKMDPALRDRIFTLRSIQDEYIKDAFEQYQNDLALLEKKYEALYAPLYAHRAQLINGEVEPTELEVQKGIPECDIAKAEQQMKDEAANKKPATDVKGIPDFWLHALEHDHEIGSLITERDHSALQALSDIRCVLHDDPKTGFTLLFFFDPKRNKHFENTCLSKRIDIRNEAGVIELVRTVGTEIQWKPHQNLTIEEKSKKQRSKKTKEVRFVTVNIPCASFFRFFLSNEANAPPPEEEVEDEEDETMFTLTAEEDHELALKIKDRIIPRAVEFFTGEADSENDDDEFDEDDESDYDEEDDEDDEEEMVQPGRRQQANHQNHNQARGRNAPGGKKKENECKQQ